MKNLITLLTILSFSSTIAFASNTPATKSVTVDQLEIFTTTNFETASETLDFTTNTDIAVIQIYNAEGTMEFQLPVMTNNVQLNKNLFETGEYKLGFVLEGDSNVHLTRITVK